MAIAEALDDIAEAPASQAHSDFKLGELFCGPGGMAWGASQARSGRHSFSHAWVNDNDQSSCDTFRHNIPIDPEQVRCCDVRDLDFGSMPPIDGLAFGFPCNDFSIVGDRNGINGDYGSLYKWGVRALEHFRPLFFVAENVSGIGSSGNKQDLDVILEAFVNAGYDLRPHTYQFEDYGIPQSRHRVIIVGFRKDLQVTDFGHPAPSHKPVSCREALRNIPKSAKNQESTAHPEKVIRRLRHIKPGENAFTANLPEELRLRMKSGALISQIYRRLKPDEPAYTVTGSGGGGTHVYHWKQDRALTNRERARLQTFPDNFEFLGGKESVRKQIGMAVPPKGARLIFEAILAKLVQRSIASQC